ncbi:MAG TPA: ABC transporter permease subunit [Pseudonocardiaceae bacterium]|nr:ABC transporter permease subunit [Pseudonocardiaceae bacterium]
MRSALHAEWTKLRTEVGFSWLLLAVVAVTVVLGVVVTGAVHCTAPAGCVPDLPKLSLSGVQVGQVVVAVLAVLVISGEYSSGMIRTTFTAMPRRLTVLAAKAVVLTLPVAVAGCLAVLISLLASRFLLARNGLSLPLGEGAVLRAAVGSVLYLVLIGLLSLGIATAVRDAAASIGVVLGLFFLFPIVIGMVSDPVLRRHLEQISPTAAGLAVQATTGLGSLPIGPWSGLAVLAGWAGGALAVGLGLLWWRDA